MQFEPIPLTDTKISNINASLCVRKEYCVQCFPSEILNVKNVSGNWFFKGSDFYYDRLNCGQVWTQEDVKVWPNNFLSEQRNKRSSSVQELKATFERLHHFDILQ